MTNWLHRIILWLDRPHHRDWRPAPASDRFRRWAGEGWEYRDMTQAEAIDNIRDTAWY